MNIDDLTIGQAKELSQMFGDKNNSCHKPLVSKGDKIFTRTLTYHYIGEVVEDNEDHIILDKCSWVADSGQFTNAIKNGNLDELEIIGDGVKLLKQNITIVFHGCMTFQKKENSNESFFRRVWVLV